MRPETDTNVTGRSPRDDHGVNGRPSAPRRTALTAAVPAAAERLRRIRPRRPHLPRVSRGKMLVYLSLLGPGIVTASAGNDAGGVATYASAGAKYGYGMICTMVLLILAL